MITNYPKVTRLWVALLDSGVTLASYICAAYLRNELIRFYPFGSPVDWHAHWEIIVAILLVWRGLFGFQEAYIGQRFTSLKADLLVVVKTVLFGTLAVLTFAFLIKSNVPRTLIFTFSILNLLLLGLEKALLHQFIRYLRKQGKNIKKVLVLGAGDVAKALSPKPIPT